MSGALHCDVPVRVCLGTPLGVIVVRLLTERAPETAHNFLRYVDEGRYERISFYRATRPDNECRPLRIIQGGLGPEYEEKPPLPPIAHESTRYSGLSHVDGALSMARWAPGTAASEFFIVIGDTPQLDFGGTLNPDGHGFAVFGQVVSGMPVVRRINAGATGTISSQEYMKGQALTPPVTASAVRCTEE